MVMAWNQARIRCSGGRSSREAWSGGDVQNAGKGTMRPPASTVGRRRLASARLILTGPPGAAFGSTGSVQGAELRHGPELSRLEFEVDSGAAGRVSAESGPQQHDPPRHFMPHLQSCPSAAPFCARDIDSAKTFRAPPSVKISAAASAQRQPRPICSARACALTPVNLPSARKRAH